HTITRGSAGAFDVGDAGGVVFHPVARQFFAAQGVKALWISNGTLSPPVLRTQPATPSETNENKAALFYSAAAARRVGNTAQVRLALGTNRVWLADDWNPAAGNTAWITLTSKNDPRAPNALDDDQDKIGDGKVVACRWADDNRLIALVRSD